MKNSFDRPAATSVALKKVLPAIPQYLQAHYWWAYVHPRAVHVFERQWLVNLILWGNYKRLCNALLQGYGQHLPGRTLQIACAYGDLTPRLAACVAPGGMLEIVDILPIQLENLSGKLAAAAPVRMHCMDSAALGFADGSFDRALLFFLLHEQPQAVRERTLAEALRVVRPGGTLTIVDYAPPSRLNPLRYFWKPVLDRLEPFARDLFSEEVAAWLPRDGRSIMVSKQRFFGGMYQMLTLQVVAGASE
ncbi:MAG: Demethylmenaquinone methyltransferase [Accumulibacter sp.]|uniref:rhodoquinone biosynthesis methyltransferase RquA n=1 Tax=Accumulibacter sp. TaxID=2053492 RepID=UPI00121304DB|nr:rhodoquinone biosynthesis methyltransferase RquA [Accumulibacter sp.]QKS31051.1 MAG: class I SAM-dependent methyltransferase [Candidatus Accumulibacter similis]TLD44167.1 MAG: Demethylmenaquinone methyltransferase [Accumulibacter sp.]